MKGHLIIKGTLLSNAYHSNSVFNCYESNGAKGVSEFEIIVEINSGLCNIKSINGNECRAHAYQASQNDVYAHGILIIESVEWIAF